MFAHPDSRMSPEKNIPVYAKMSKCSSILVLSVKSNKVGTWRTFVHPASSKCSSIFFRYKSDGRSPFFPSNCLFWFKATAKATTENKKRKLPIKKNSEIKLTNLLNLIIDLKVFWYHKWLVYYFYNNYKGILLHVLCKLDTTGETHKYFIIYSLKIPMYWHSQTYHNDRILFPWMYARRNHNHVF